MYNKLFNKIVDSSIWMEPDNVRIVWLMFIAIMDEDGFVNLASSKNVAHRAVMDLEKAQQALAILEGPDLESSNPANEGRRITRVPGGWMVNNAKEYRDIVRREQQKILGRERVQKHRLGNADVTLCNAGVTGCNENVTPSEAEAEAEANTENNLCGLTATEGSQTKPETNDKPKKTKRPTVYSAEFEEFWKAYPPRDGRKPGKPEAFAEWKRVDPSDLADLLEATKHYAAEVGKPDARKPRDAVRFIKQDFWRAYIEPVKSSVGSGVDGYARTAEEFNRR